jgi:hypothetical protein
LRIHLAAFHETTLSGQLRRASLQTVASGAALKTSASIRLMTRGISAIGAADFEITRRPRPKYVRVIRADLNRLYIRLKPI